MNLFHFEQFSREGFHVKNAYIDIADDLTAGILLGQIVYWFMPDQNGESKLRVERDNRLWLVKGRDDWWDEIRLKARQVDRALEILKEKGFVETKKFRYNNAPTTHIQLNERAVNDAIRSHLTDSGKRNLRNGENEQPRDFPDSLITDAGNPISRNRELELTDSLTGNNESVNSSYTEITTEITTENTAENTDARTESEPKPLSFFDAYLLAYGKQPTPLQAEKLMAYVEDGMEPEVINKAIEKAAMAGAGLNYATTVLNNWSNEGMNTLEAVEKAEEKRKQEQAAKGRGNGKRPIRTEKLPDWFPDHTAFQEEGQKIEKGIEAKEERLDERRKRLEALKDKYRDSNKNHG